LAGGFLKHDRGLKTVRLLRDFLAEFNGLSSTVKRSQVLEEVELQRAPLERLLLNGDFDHDLVDRLLAAMRNAAKPVKADRLGMLGRENIAAALEGYGADMATFRYKRIVGIDDDVPTIAEAAFAYRPDAAGLAPIAGINWAPALDVNHDPFDIGHILGNCYCRHDSPVVVLAHLICPRPQFLDRGKSRLATNSPGFYDVRNAVQFVLTDWAKQREREIRDASQRRKREEKLRAEKPRDIPIKDLVLKYLPFALAKTSNNGKISFSQRDVFYVIRKPIQEEHGKTLEYNYFTSSILTNYENAHGDIPGMQREPRGTIYHPHLHEKIPLGTASVAGYSRPFWTFNKLVVVEKTGTQDNLIEVGWPEEHDCAVASVIGFTTRAIKDLLDALSISTEPLTVFCVHDADSFGTLIYETLVRETKARKARKINVVNLGLDPWEGIDMSLEVEPVEPSRRRRPVARYVHEHDVAWRRWLKEHGGFTSWAGWLQKNRIELNALAPADRIDWITKKIEDYPPRKVIPPTGELHDVRVEAARRIIYGELERRARLDERTDEILKELVWPVPKDRLPRIAERYLDRDRFRRLRWSAPMHEAGEKLAARVMKAIPEGQPS
jgi:hypothetical protein